MIGVLIDSRRPGSTSWVYVRHTRLIRVRGMEEGIDRVEVHFVNLGPILVNCNGDYAIPQGEERIQLRHVQSSGNPVYADLVRK